jgi:hypothetical protein
MKTVIHKFGLYGAAIAGGVLTRTLLARVWEATTDRPPPKNPDAVGVSWKEALIWGATAGVLAGLSRTVARKSYTTLTHTRPERIE